MSKFEIRSGLRLRRKESLSVETDNDSAFVGSLCTRVGSKDFGKWFVSFPTGGYWMSEDQIWNTFECP